MLRFDFPRFTYLHRDVDKNGIEVSCDWLVEVLRAVDKERVAEALRIWAESTRWGNDFCERNTTFLESGDELSILRAVGESVFQDGDHSDRF